MIAMERVYNAEPGATAFVRDFHVLQLETTVGSAIRKFNKTLAIEVERKLRYLPVKVKTYLIFLRHN